MTETRAIGSGWRAWIPAGILAAVWLGLALYTAAVKSPFIDEVVHTPAGLSYWAHGDYRMNPEHPLLVKLLAAAPVYFFDRPDLRVFIPPDGTVTPWLLGYQAEWGHYLMFMRGEQEDLLRRNFLSRMVPIGFGLLGGLLALLWTRQQGGGVAAATAAMGLLLLYPEYAGHAVYVTMDVPVLVGLGGSLLLLWRFWLRPGWWRGVLFLLGAGPASQIKLPVGPVTIAGLLALVMVAAAVPRRRNRLLPMLLLLGAMMVFVYILVWGMYGFRFEYTRADHPIEDRSEHIPPRAGPEISLRQRAVNFAWEHRLLPEAALATVQHLEALERRRAFLLGDTSPDGYLHYFAVSFLAKTPLSWLAFLAVAIVYLYRRWTMSAGRRLRAELALGCVLPVALFLAALAFSRVNIGHRHILFVYLPLAVLSGIAVGRWLGRAGVWRRAAAAVLAVYTTECAFAFPNGATYFNLAAGGDPYHGSRILRDSNTDAGQDYPALAAWMGRNNAGPINAALTGIVRPDPYGITDYRWILPNDPIIFQRGTDQPPDPALPTAASVNHLETLVLLYPELYGREPDLFLNSIVVFLPGE